MQRGTLVYYRYDDDDDDDDNNNNNNIIVQELCESRGGRPGLSVLTSLPVSVDVKLY